MTVKISVIGTGYLGAVHAACMAQLGHEVVAVDTDAAKIDALAAGRSPIYEPGLDELLAEVLPTGRITFTTDIASAADCDVHFICVGTPQRADSYAANTDYVFAAARSLAGVMKPDALVVGKSTVPAGTSHELRKALCDAGGFDAVRLLWNPEFLRESFAIEDTLHPDRFVYGVQGPSSDADVALLDEVYATPLADGTPRLVMDITTAELVKVSANAFLATKISFINAMAEVCEAAGADVTALAQAIGYDDRIGHKFLGAGVGFGGGCLPKDIRAFMARADELEVPGGLAFLREVDAINERRRSRVVTRATQLLGGDVTGKRVAVLGAAFKPNSDDIRDSPSLEIAWRLANAGAQVRVHDPKALPVARALRPESDGLRYVDDIDEALSDADIVLHLTEWQEYRDLDPAAVAQATARRMVIDGRNKLDVDAWRAAGWTVEALGRTVGAGGGLGVQ